MTNWRVDELTNWIIYYPEANFLRSGVKKTIYILISWYIYWYLDIHLYLDIYLDIHLGIHLGIHLDIMFIVHKLRWNILSPAWRFWKVTKYLTKAQPRSNFLHLPKPEDWWLNILLKFMKNKQYYFSGIIWKYLAGNFWANIRHLPADKR